MRIAIVTETFLPKMDGIVRTLLELLQYLRLEGHDALVITAGPGSTWAEGFEVMRVPGLRFPLYPELTLAPVAPRVRRAMESFRPDVVHLAGPCVLGAVAVGAARRLRQPTAAHFQTDLARYAAHFGFSALSPVLRRYLVALHNRCDVNYAPTPSIARELRSRGMRRVRVSGRGVDSALFHPLRRNGRDADLLYVGRLSVEKNLDWLVDLANAFPDKSLRVVGDGPYRRQLEGRLAGRKVTFSGILQGIELAEAFASANLFVFPSHTETFGQVVQEAMASGLPVIGVRAGGVPDLVQPGETGLLCEPCDKVGFVKATSLLLTDAQSRQRMGRAARSFAEAQTWRAVFDALLNDYRQLARSGRGTASPLHLEKGVNVTYG